jgi:hypothetical protein
MDKSMSVAQVLRIPRSNILGLSMDKSVQHVSTGGGRSIGGAVVGAVIAGPVGAIVGGRSSSNITRLDESKTYFSSIVSGMQFQMTFDGGQPTYNVLTSLFIQFPQQSNTPPEQIKAVSVRRSRFDS